MYYLSVPLTLSTGHSTEMAAMTREHEAKQSLLMQELRAPLAFLSTTSTPAQPSAHTRLHLRAGVAAVRVLVASLCSQLSSATAHIEARVPPRAPAPSFCCHAHEHDSEAASAQAEIQLGEWGAVSMQEVVSICMGGKAMANRWRPTVQSLIDLTLKLVQQLQILQRDHAALVASTAADASSNAGIDTSAATGVGTAVNDSKTGSTAIQAGEVTVTVTILEVIAAATACLDPQVPIARCRDTLSRIVRSVLDDIQRVLRSVLATSGFKGDGGVASCVTTLATLTISADEHDANDGDSVTKDKDDTREDDSDEDADEDGTASVLDTLREDMAFQQTLYHMSINPSHTRIQLVHIFKLYTLARGNQPDTRAAIAAAKWTQTVCTRLLGHGHTYTFAAAYEDLRLRGLMLEDKTAYETMEEENQLRDLLKVLCCVCMKLYLNIGYLGKFIKGKGD